MPFRSQFQVKRLRNSYEFLVINSIQFDFAIENGFHLQKLFSHISLQWLERFALSRQSPWYVNMSKSIFLFWFLFICPSTLFIFFFFFFIIWHFWPIDVCLSLWPTCLLQSIHRQKKKIIKNWLFATKIANLRRDVDGWNLITKKKKMNDQFWLLFFFYRRLLASMAMSSL